MKRMLIAAGGTGGHIFPALAVAETFKKQGVEVHWVGTSVGLESKLVPDYFSMHFVKINRLRGKRLRQKALLPWQLMRSVWQVWRLLRQFKPDVVLTMGGFVSGPAGIAAWLVRIPLVIHEQNSVAGLTNRVLAKIASQVLQAFPNTFESTIKAKTVGNPARQMLIDLSRLHSVKNIVHGKLRLLVLGGSQGAHALNEVVAQLMQQQDFSCHIELWHQTGEKECNKIAAQYNLLSNKIKVEPFIHNIGEAYRWADLVMCRAGALTITELCVMGVASVLIPFPDAADNHQYHNAQSLVHQGAAYLLPQTDLTVDRLKKLLATLIAGPDKLQRMASRAQQLATLNATESVVQLCRENCREPV